MRINGPLKNPGLDEKLDIEIQKPVTPAFEIALRFT
jgi:hypothetical protein